MSKIQIVSRNMAIQTDILNQIEAAINLTKDETRRKNLIARREVVEANLSELSIQFSALKNRG